jgi:hypothetical protein
MSKPRTENRSPGGPGRAARRGATLAALICILLPAAVPTALAADAGPVRDHALDTGARFEVTADGIVRVLAPAGAEDETLLRISTGLHPARPVRRSGDRAFTALRREGDEGGRRGFSARSDDDEDGLVDEDRLDGRDNDGDGRVDEDHAAIGDAMTVVGVMRGGRALLLETYHWDYPHLRETLVTSWRREDRGGEPQRDVVTLELPYGSWQEMSVGWDEPRDAADEMMMVAVLPRDGGRWWLGVTVLVREAEEADGPPRVDGRRLELPCRGTLVCAVSVTTTLSQLRHRQATAHAVHAGAPAEPGQPAVPWIVPPLSKADCEHTLAAVWREGDAGWRLSLEIPAGHAPLVDPETLRAGAVRLGAPGRVSWLGADGPDGVVAWEEPWPHPDHGELWRADASPHPYRAHLADLLSRVGGTLTFHYPGAAPLEDETPLTCRTLCGQDVAVAATRAVGAPVETHAPAGEEVAAADEAELLADASAGDRRAPLLSPDLLDNFPNPFHDQTRLRYRIPATVGEGFVWEEGQQPTLKLDDPIPYPSGTPLVSLKIYTVAGHEVVTLFDGTCSIGTYETTWDGNDRDGRPMAVGTYFCKLQIENWSVTKRVALLR